jgi:TRAP-type C4-dicarboxylate transport system substrate-binding protein
VAQYYTVTEHTMGPEVLVMSRRAWQELSDEDRVIFRTAARDSSKYMRRQWQSWEEQSKTQALAGGVEIIGNIDRKPFEDATASLRDAMHADPKFGPLIERIQAVR